MHRGATVDSGVACIRSAVTRRPVEDAHGSACSVLRLPAMHKAWHNALSGFLNITSRLCSRLACSVRGRGARTPEYFELVNVPVVRDRPTCPVLRAHCRRWP